MAEQTKTFLVSGCASGIGKHMALELAKRGQRAMLVDIDVAALERVVQEAGLLNDAHIAWHKHDVRDFAGWERLVAQTVARFGSLDVMLNIAGFLQPGYVDQLSEQDVDRQIDVNVKGVMHATRAGARQMKQQKSGHIVNIASIAGIACVPGMSVYCASKHAVRGFTLSVAHELRPHGVHVSVVCPDAVETPMVEAQVGHEEAALTFGGGKCLTVEQVGEAIFGVLEDKSMEVVLSVPGSGRVALAKLANMFPPLAKLGIERVRKRGLAVQQKRTLAR
ncbi:MAG TPA: SDR family oxidoreductase [Polyangiales bacterium]|nr:SDR family oxidoreductase [Polyangiales bacterium]